MANAPWASETCAREWIDNGGMQVVLGVDGGGTNTSCVVMNCKSPTNEQDSQSPEGSAFCGKVCGEGTAGSSNYHSVGGEYSSSIFSYIFVMPQSCCVFNKVSHFGEASGGPSFVYW
jgi:hypothetical protein